jgi:hypothetical protein
MVTFRNTRPKTSESSSGKFGATLFGLIFMGMGLVFAGLILSQAITNIKVRTWKETPCTISESSVKTVPDGYAVSVEYTYKVNAKTYHSSQFQPGSTQITEKQIHKADALAGKFRKDSRTICYVNPDNPNEAVLKHGSLWTGLVVLFPMIFVIIGGGIIYGTWFASDKAPKTYSLSEKAEKKESGKRFQTGLFLIFFFAGFGFGYFLVFPAAMEYVDSDNWIETACTVRSSRVQTHDGSDSTTYSVDIVYEYVFNGQTFRSSRYTFIGGSSSGYQGKAAVVRQYPAGKSAVCYVNPDNPSVAVLNRQLGAEAFLALIPILFMIIGIAGAIHSLRKSGTGRGFTNLAGKTVGADTGLHSPFEPIVLKPKTSRIGKIFGSIAISLFWNGIVSVFVYHAWQGWHAGHPDYFLTVFMIPFVVVGLVMIGSIFYFSLAAFNPRPVIILLKDTIRLGDRVPIRWAMSGNVYKIQNFKLTLTGEETATYRRGTKTHTDRQVFYEKDIVSDHNPESMRRGETFVQVPAESMHSFKSDNNSITWKISMHCDVPRWPDSKDDFEINIFPMLIEDF